ncbi:hypothetical protein BZA77DRAFT_12512 [Pyronema omphalodes]|nr:hypothetical protein BZA77DRAFT_12512 [Pyronema omphalodes]
MNFFLKKNGYNRTTIKASSLFINYACFFFFVIFIAMFICMCEFNSVDYAMFLIHTIYPPSMFSVPAHMALYIVISFSFLIPILMSYVPFRGVPKRLGRLAERPSNFTGFQIPTVPDRKFKALGYRLTIFGVYMYVCLDETEDLVTYVLYFV